MGDDDGGKLFTPEQYEVYKRDVLPQRVKNRLYVSFGVPGGIDCKLVGPETQCFCTHRYYTTHKVIHPSTLDKEKYMCKYCIIVQVQAA